MWKRTVRFDGEQEKEEKRVCVNDWGETLHFVWIVSWLVFMTSMHLVLRINYPKSFTFRNIFMGILILSISMGEFDVVFTTSVVLRCVDNIKKAIFCSHIVYTARTRKATMKSAPRDRQTESCMRHIVAEIASVCVLFCTLFATHLFFLYRAISFRLCISAGAVALSHSRSPLHFY